MANDGTGGRPCTSCGTEVPDDRSVCPACAAFQPARMPAPGAASVPSPPGTTGAPLPPPPPPLFSGPTAYGASASSPGAPGPRATGPGRTSVPLVVVFVLILVAIAGGVYVVTQRDDSPSSEAASDQTDAPQSDLQDALDQADEFADSLAASTTAAAGGSSTTAPPAKIAWAQVTDPASGLRWSMPGTDIQPVTDMVGLTIGGPTGDRKTWGTFDYGLSVDVTVWDPSNQATPDQLDEIMTNDKDLHDRINEPYGTDLTIAGQPAVAVLSTPEPDSTYVAMAIVDGALVRVQVAAAGQPVDPAIFERLVASFDKG